MNKQAMPTPTKDPHPEILNHPDYKGSPRKLVEDKTNQVPKVDCEGCFMSVWKKDEHITKYYHVCCAVEPVYQPSLKHPEFGDLSFCTQPPTDKTKGVKPATNPLKRLCNVCKKPVNGFVYHGEKARFGIHPCCVFKESPVKCSDVVPKNDPRILPEGPKWNHS